MVMTFRELLGYLLGKQNLHIGKVQWQYKIKVKAVTKVIARWNTINYEISLCKQ